MGNNLFGVGISKLIKDNIGPNVLNATLTKVTPGTRSASEPTQGTNPTTTDYACKGFIDTQKVRFKAGTLVEGGKKVAVLIGDTISNGTVTPAPGDFITIEGTKYQIPEDGMIDRDPDAATYTCEIRKA
jgi:hypothetical protein